MGRGLWGVAAGVAGAVVGLPVLKDIGEGLLDLVGFEPKKPSDQEVVARLEGGDRDMQAAYELALRQAGVGSDQDSAYEDVSLAANSTALGSVPDENWNQVSAQNTPQTLSTLDLLQSQGVNVTRNG